MDNLDIKNLQLSYQAIYDETLCESMEELGFIGEKESVDEERAPGVKPYKPSPTQAEVRADAAKSKKKKKADSTGYGPDEKFTDWKLNAVPGSVDRKGRSVSQRMDSEKPYATRPIGPLFTKFGSRTAANVTRATEGPGEPQAVTMPRKKSKPSREIIRKGKQEEGVDFYDLILSHLLDEGYANTVENAEAIMVNMSEEWVGAIVEAKRSLPIGKMKRKESQLLDSPEADAKVMAALRTPVGSPERKAAMKQLERLDNINTARTSISKRGGKEPHPMPEVGRYKPKYED